MQMRITHRGVKCSSITDDKVNSNVPDRTVVFTGFSVTVISWLVGSFII